MNNTLQHHHSYSIWAITTADCTTFEEKLTTIITQNNERNLILDFTDADQEISTLVNVLCHYGAQHKNNRQSFVVVIPHADYNQLPEELCVVPTLQEAYDMIEMEEIERDLGF